ncbi:MAG TPA: acetate/propionate family kinase [Steroidobacteraceae bacterium]|nr:acetate/propionate family kinase [Steroidobacteraceae bacterium]
MIAGGEVAQVLAVNGGSSSVRFALFSAGPTRTYHGRIDRIGLPGTYVEYGAADGEPQRHAVAAADHRGAAAVLLERLDAARLLDGVAGVGHRVVHGMGRAAPERATAALLKELRSVASFDPEHLPREIDLIEALGARLPDVPQIACYDTAFHATMPTCATRLPIPRRYGERGVRRYGFHGLSYAYLREELANLGDAAIARGRVILAHLGNGASMAALRDGRSIDTTMGFTPAGGLVMSTRSGDLDPGLAYYFLRSAGQDAAQFQRMVNHESGLLGISATSSDVRDLLAREADDPRAAEALAVFCYQARKWIGALAAALGGLDTLAFAGGIGENAAPIRARICADLGFLGIRLDEARNARHAPLISPDGAPVAVRVVPTDEERMIARATFAAIAR